MLPREELFNRTFSALAEIRHWSINSIKLTDNNSNRPASSKKLTERKEAVCGMFVAYYIYDTEIKSSAGDLVLWHEYSVRNLDCMSND